MRIRPLFLPFVLVLAGLFSCDGTLLDLPQTEDPASDDPDSALTTAPGGYITVDKEKYCSLSSVRGADSEGNQKWEFLDGKDVRAKVSSWRCRCRERDHIGYHVSEVVLDLPGVSSMSIPLQRTEGDDYISGNKSVSGAHLNRYTISEDGKYLEFDISITLYRETKGDIRIVYSGPF